MVAMGLPMPPPGSLLLAWTTELNSRNLSEEHLLHPEVPACDLLFATLWGRAHLWFPALARVLYPSFTLHRKAFSAIEAEDSPDVLGNFIHVSAASGK